MPLVSLKPEAGVELAGAADAVWHKELLHHDVIAQNMHTLLRVLSSFVS